MPMPILIAIGTGLAAMAAGSVLGIILAISWVSRR